MEKVCSAYHCRWRYGWRSPPRRNAWWAWGAPRKTRALSAQSGYASWALLCWLFHPLGSPAPTSAGAPSVSEEEPHEVWDIRHLLVLFITNRFSNRKVFLLLLRIGMFPFTLCSIFPPFCSTSEQSASIWCSIWYTWQTPLLLLPPTAKQLDQPWVSFSRIFLACIICSDC